MRREVGDEEEEEEEEEEKQQGSRVAIRQQGRVVQAAAARPVGFLRSST